MTKEPVTFTAGCVIERDYVFVAAKPDAIDDEAEFSRVFFFDGQDAAQPWVHDDLPDRTVVAVAVALHTGLAPRVYASLSRQGEVVFTWPGGGRKVEAIEGAGLERTAPPIFGHVHAMREIGGKLHVCGSGGQVYRRDADGWRHIAEPLRAPAALIDADAADVAAIGKIGRHEFAAIDGWAEDDLYVAGGDGDIHHFDGARWAPCTTPDATTIMTALHCAGDGEVWACGWGGALWRGNKARGFDAVAPRGKLRFDCVRRFGDDGRVYLAGSGGLMAFDPRRGTIAPVRAGALGKVADAMALDAADGVLLVLGHDALTLFDGKRWVRLEHPDNAAS